MTDSPRTLFDALPRNVLALAKEAERGVKAGIPGYLNQFTAPSTATIFSSCGGHRVPNGRWWSKSYSPRCCFRPARTNRTAAYRTPITSQTSPASSAAIPALSRQMGPT